MVGIVFGGSIVVELLRQWWGPVGTVAIVPPSVQSGLALARRAIAPVLLIFTFLACEEERIIGAALMTGAGALIKIFPAAGGVFALVPPQPAGVRAKRIATFVAAGALLALTPLLVTTPSALAAQYHAWFTTTTTTSHVLRYPRQATFHPLKYLAGVAKACGESGVAFFRDSPVEEVAEENGTVSVKTTRGVIRAQHAVVATNSSISDRFAIHTKTAPYRTYVITFEIKRGALPDALYWDTEYPLCACNRVRETRTML